jgi:hypothetical protein
MAGLRLFRWRVLPRRGEARGQTDARCAWWKGITGLALFRHGDLVTDAVGDDLARGARDSLLQHRLSAKVTRVERSRKSWVSRLNQHCICCTHSTRLNIAIRSVLLRSHASSGSAAGGACGRPKAAEGASVRVVAGRHGLRALGLLLVARPQCSDIVQDRTVGPPVSVAVACQMPKRPAHGLQRFDLRLQILHMLEREGLHVRARALPVTPERKKLRRLLYGEAETPRSPNEPQGMDVLIAVDPVAALRSRRGADEPDPLIIPHHLGRYAGGLCCFTDVHRICS